MLRRKSARLEGPSKLELRQVIGHTASNGNGLASCPANEDVAYAAGCVVVVYNAANNSQTSFYTSSKANKAIASVAYSQSGRFLAAGEAGHQPGVLVWDTTTKACVAELKGHRYGIACLSFSPPGKHLVSVGAPHDGQICIWDWKNGVLLAKVRAAAAAAPISTLAFSADGAFFATGGVKHVKCWPVGGVACQRLKSAPGGGLESRAVALGAQKEADIVSLAAGPSPNSPGGKVIEENGTMYGVTAPGILCLLRGGKALEKWVDLKVQAAFCVKVSKQYCACACAGGVVRLFAVNTLTYVATLPKPVALKYHLAGGNAQPSAPEAFPDAVGCSYIGENKLAVVYSDHSLYIWDLSTVSHITLVRCFHGHGACIWDVASLPQSAPTQPGERSPGLATCSADGSIRLWNLEERGGQGGALVPGCQELLGAFHLDGPAVLSAGDAVRPSGFRSLAARPDGRHVAAGDRNGNLRVYDLETGKLVSFQEAHDSEILTLNYLESSSGGQNDGSLLASGGRDRLIHLYDVSRNYDVIETLDDHSASITAVRFASDGSRLLSCSADKSIVFRSLSPGASGVKSIRYHQEVASRGSLYDLDVDPGDKLVVTAGQEKRLTLYSLATGKPVRSFRPDSDAGEPIKVKMDPGGVSLLCSHSDKSIRIFDVQSGDLLAKGTGHSEVCTGLVLSPSCAQLISVSGDSCIFVWQLPGDLTRAIRRKAAAFARPSAPPLPPSLMPIPPDTSSVAVGKPSVEKPGAEAPFTFPVPAEVLAEARPAVGEEEADVEDDVSAIDFKMSVSKLPSWARPQGAAGAAAGGRGGQRPVVVPGESRWAQRIGQEGYRLFSEGGEDPNGPGGSTVRASGFGQSRKFTTEKTAGPALMESFSENDAESGLRRHSSDGVSDAAAYPGRGARRASEGDGTSYILEGASRGGVQRTGGEKGGEREEKEEGEYSSDSDFDEEESPKTQEKEDSESEKIKRVDRVTGAEMANGGVNGLEVGVNGTGAGVNVPEGSANGPDNGVNGPEAWDDGDEVELGEEMEDSPRTDLFADHFDSLKRQTPVDTNRQSLSARFFARLSLSPPPPSDAPASDPPESPSAGVQIDLSADDDDSLTSQRERLKQRDRASRMAAEVARLRARMSGLGIAVLPRQPADAAVMSPPASLPADVTSSSGGEVQALSGGGGTDSGASQKLEVGAWMVSDRAGKAVTPPGTLDEATRNSSFQGGTASAEDSGIATPPREASSQLEGSSNKGPEAGVLPHASRTRGGETRGGEETAETVPPRRLSPWAARTNPLFDSEHARGESPPGPVPPLNAAARLGTAAGSETPNPEALEGADEDEASPCDEEVRRRSHLSPRDGGHVSPGTPPPERSQSPDLDHERNQRTEPPSEPLILDHTKRNNTTRTALDARFGSPSLAEGIPTLPMAGQKVDREISPALSTELSFPRLLEAGSEPSPRLASPKAEVSDSEDDAEELQTVALSGEALRVASKDFEEPNENKKTIAADGYEGAVAYKTRGSGGEDANDDIQRVPQRKTSGEEAQKVESRAASDAGIAPRFALAEGHSLGDLASVSSEDTAEREAERTAADGPERTDRTAVDASESADACGGQKTVPSEARTERSGDADVWSGAPEAREPVQSLRNNRGPSALGSVDEDLETVQSDGPESLPQLQSQGFAPRAPSPDAPLRPPLPVTESVELPRPTEEYHSALRALVDAADRASLLFEELKAFKAVAVPSSSVTIASPRPPPRGPDVSALTQSYQEFVPSAVRKLQRMMEDTSAPGAADVTGAPLTSEARGSVAENGDGARVKSFAQTRGASEGRGSVNASVDSMLASVDMEAVLERYSERYSERLAQQLLAIMSKSLQSSHQL